MQKKFWRGKKVIITGSGGFIGQHLCRQLVEHEANIVGLTRNPKLPFEIGIDVVDTASVKKAFIKFKPEFCFHLASSAIVEQGQNEPFSVYKNNIISTLNILENCREFRVNRVIVASTAHVYGKSEIPYKENQQAKPSRPYETSKACSDMMAQSYADSFHLPVLIPRFVNIYGPGDLNFTRIIPKTIKSVILQEQTVMWGGAAKREYLYIDDVIDAYLNLGLVTDRQLEKNRIYNFGTGNPISVENVIRAILTMMKDRRSVKRIPMMRDGEIINQSVDLSKVQRMLKWKHKVDFEDGLRYAIDWYRNYFRMRA